MAKKTTTKPKAPKATKSANAQTSAVQVKKDAKGRFWLVPKDGGAERGPFASKKEALDDKAGGNGPKAEGKPKAKKAKEPKEKKLSAIDAAAQVLAASKMPMNAKEMIEAMTAKALWTSLDQLTAAHSAAKAIDLKKALEGMPVPLHPGAERYYKEAGVMK